MTTIDAMVDDRSGCFGDGLGVSYGSVASPQLRSKVVSGLAVPGS